MLRSENIIILLSALCLTVGTSLKWGDKCVDSTSGLNGKCEELLFCDYALKHRKIPKSCDRLTVCCPQVQLRTSEEMCFKYHYNIVTSVDDMKKFGSMYDDQIIFVEPHIVRGKETALRQYTHMAAIGFSHNYRIQWGCGGSIISPFFILSAAHCVKHREFGVAKWVRIGDLDLVNTTEGAHPQDLHIVERFVHPDYVSTTYYNDIALFKLEKEIVFSKDYQPACLQTERNLPQIMQATGWGLTSFPGDPSSLLLEVDLYPIKYKKCAIQYRNYRTQRLPKGIILVDELQICAGNTLGKDTCDGDSGGPLQYKLGKFLNFHEHYVVTGVTSFGKGCGSPNTPGVFTRVSAHLSWIEKIVWKNEKKSVTKYKQNWFH